MGNWTASLALLALVAMPVGAQETPPPEPPAAPAPATPPPLKGEACINQCDTITDQCMAANYGDERKERACDDNYTKCLKACR